MDLKKVGHRKVLTVAKETSLEEAARGMREAHLGDVIVLNDRKVPIGILTDRDIVMATIALGVDASALLVEDIMTAGLVTVKESDSLAQVIRLMKENGVKRVPIVGDEFQLLGVIALEDVLSLLAAELSALAEVSGRQRQFEVHRRRKIA